MIKWESYKGISADQCRSMIVTMQCNCNDDDGDGHADDGDDCGDDGRVGWMHCSALVASQIQSLIIKFSCYSGPVQCSGVHHLCTFEEGFPKTKTSSETEKTLNFSISRSLIQESCMTLLQSNIEKTGPKSLCLFSCSWVRWIFLKLLIPGDFWVQFYWPIGQCQNRWNLFFGGASLNPCNMLQIFLCTDT